MTALASMQALKKSVLKIAAAVCLVALSIPQAAQAGFNTYSTAYPSFDHLLFTSADADLFFPLLPQQEEQTRRLFSKASDLAFESATTVRKFQLYPLEILPSDMLEDYVSSIMPVVESEKMEPEKEEAEEKENKIFQMLMPIKNASVSSPFGWRHGRPHQGTDFAAASGVPITAVEDGRVVFSGWKTGYGRFIAIDHGNGLITRYAHCSRLMVRTGQQLKQGTVIGRVGSTGHSTGPHLHFEVLANGVHRNPASYLHQNKTIAHAP